MAPPGINDGEPLALLDGAFTELLAEFAAHSPDDPAGTWYGPDQSVGFWIRRMAHETAIHRIDAEIAAGITATPVPDDVVGVGRHDEGALGNVSEWGIRHDSS